MIEYVKKDDILEHFCEYCDSHIVGCGECPIKSAIEEIPVFTIPENAIFACDPEKNKECSKENCFKNGGDCYFTTDVRYAIFECIELTHIVAEEKKDGEG